MVEFTSDKPIYRQIIDYAFACILGGGWQSGQKVLSVRELAVALAVNTHTVLKAYDELQAHGIIVPRRGMGFFLADDAQARVHAEQNQEFFDTTLTEIFTRMESLGIDFAQLEAAYKKFRDCR